MIKLFKPNFWKKRISFFAIILLPLSFLIQILSLIKNIIVKKHKFSVPIICVGNIYLGGTGKTPLVVKLIELLDKINRKPVVIKKFYKKHQDEVELYKSRNNKIITSLSRSQAINEAINKKFDVMILDDGLQDRSIKKDLSIVCFNESQLIGNGYTIPSGPLREPLSSLKDKQIVLINGKRSHYLEEKIHKISKNINIYYSEYVPSKIEKYKNQKLLAFAGIGNPENFFNLLKKYKLDIRHEISFPDHHFYSEKDLKIISKIAENKDLNIITTEKDFYRCKELKLYNINYLSVSLIINNEDKLLDEIKNYIQ
jgi:tetraacyldisaccharide 4'-kinase